MKTTFTSLTMILLLTSTFISCGKNHSSKAETAPQVSPVNTDEREEDLAWLSRTINNSRIKVKKFFVEDQRTLSDDGVTTIYSPRYLEAESAWDLERCEIKQRIEIAKAKLPRNLNIGIHVYEITSLKEEAVKRLKQPFKFRGRYFTADHQRSAGDYEGAFLGLEVLAVNNGVEKYKGNPPCTVISAKEIAHLLANPSDY